MPLMRTTVFSTRRPAQNLFIPSNGLGIVEWPLTTLHQGVPYLREQFHLARRRRLARRILLLLTVKLVHGLDHHEQDENHDHEADHIVDEQADIHGRGAGVSGHSERVVMFAVQRNEDAAEINAAGDDADRRHDNVVQRRLQMVENAAPMMMPTAMSMTLPRSANSLNSFSIAGCPRKCSHCLKPLACHVWAPIQTRL